jgi:hypothetical protein
VKRSTHELLAVKTDASQVCGDRYEGNDIRVAQHVFGDDRIAVTVDRLEIGLAKARFARAYAVRTLLVLEQPKSCVSGPFLRN